MSTNAVLKEIVDRLPRFAASVTTQKISYKPQSDEEMLDFQAHDWVKNCMIMCYLIGRGHANPEEISHARAALLLVKLGGNLYEEL